jgi:hypothetical protein
MTWVAGSGADDGHRRPGVPAGGLHRPTHVNGGIHSSFLVFAPASTSLKSGRQLAAFALSSLGAWSSGIGALVGRVVAAAGRRPPAA